MWYSCHRGCANACSCIIDWVDSTLFGITAPKTIALTYAHDAVWFIAGSLALGATLVKYGLDKRVGMLVVNLLEQKLDQL